MTHVCNSEKEMLNTTDRPTQNLVHETKPVPFTSHPKFIIITIIIIIITIIIVAVIRLI
jgi:hypothetical protein